jgi:hypothetical protein
MHEQDTAILKSFASHDGRVSREETELIEALLWRSRQRPKKRRSSVNTPRRRVAADIPVTELSADDRRILLQHAVLITFIDGEQAPEEKAASPSSARSLRIPADEAKNLLGTAEGRAKRFLDLL